LQLNFINIALVTKVSQKDGLVDMIFFASFPETTTTTVTTITTTTATTTTATTTTTTTTADPGNICFFFINSSLFLRNDL
jgi:hypothetical protein